MRIGIFGAGVAGLSCAYFLKKHFSDIQVHEASDQVGGLARSFQWHGFTCDHAPHRLFTTNEELLKELLELVPMDEKRRQSRIFLQGKWIQDPVNAAEMVIKFFPFKSFKIVWNYLFKRNHGDANFEALVLSKFGKTLNQLFFKPYSEKLFGIPATQISASWGKKKLRVSGIRDMLRRNSKLYFKHFYYPKQNGYGAICDRLYDEIRDSVTLKSRLFGVTHNAFNNTYRCEFERDGRVFEEEYDQVVTSLPISLFSQLMGLNLTLKFRPASLAYLLVNKPTVTSNHWFYYADSKFIINRVAEFKNFSDHGVPADKTVLCCEVTRVEQYSIDRVVSDLEASGIITKKDVVDSKTINLQYAYPIYDLDFERQMKIAEMFYANHPRIHHVGRHAQFAHKDVDEIFEEAKRVAGAIVAGCRPKGEVGAAEISDVSSVAVTTTAEVAQGDAVPVIAALTAK